MPRIRKTPTGDLQSFSKPLNDDLETRPPSAGTSYARPQIAVDYQEITDRINPLIARAEKALAGMRLSVSGAIELEPPENGWLTQLAFRKADKEWGLFVEIGAEGQQDKDWDVTRLHNASRATRLRALKILPDLAQELFQRAQDQMRGAAETVDEAETFIAALEARRP
jgi:hypothetical protein